MEEDAHEYGETDSW
jgi:hypothetical protein